MIRKAVNKDLKRVKQITEACAVKMIEDKIYQWNDSYPSLEVFEQDILEGALHVIEEENTVWGCIMFSPKKDAVYNSVQWLTPDSENLYVHRLAVDPVKQGLGYAQKLMGFMEDCARSRIMHSIRLDTFSQNPKNLSFYKKQGFQQLGTVYFPNQSEFPFYCFEKVLDP
ncbi:MAG: GNAT family N-acetyltransferase [Flavobacteriaceae bacterium]